MDSSNVLAITKGTNAVHGRSMLGGLVLLMLDSVSIPGLCSCSLPPSQV